MLVCYSLSSKLVAVEADSNNHLKPAIAFAALRYRLAAPAQVLTICYGLGAVG